MKKKSTIPEHLQVPVAIVLAVLFAALLYWRFGMGEGEQPDTASETAAVTQTFGGEQVDTSTLESLMASIESTPAAKRTAPETPLALGRNPFLPSSWEMAAMTRDREASEDNALLERELLPVGPTREERLEVMALTATYRQPGWAMAIIDGRYVRQGDEVDMFTVKEIHESHVVLRDDVGESTLPLAQKPLFEPSLPDSETVRGALP